MCVCVCVCQRGGGVGTQQLRLPHCKARCPTPPRPLHCIWPVGASIHTSKGKAYPAQFPCYCHAVARGTVGMPGYMAVYDRTSSNSAARCPTESSSCIAFCPSTLAFFAMTCKINPVQFSSVQFYPVQSSSVQFSSVLSSPGQFSSVQSHLLGVQPALCWIRDVFCTKGVGCKKTSQIMVLAAFRNKGEACGVI